MVKSGKGVELQVLQGLNLIPREVEDSQGSIVASGLPRVVRLKSPHSRGDLGQGVLQGQGDVLEDLRRRQRSSSDESPGEVAIESKLKQHRVGGGLGDTVRGSDGARESGRRGVGIGVGTGASALRRRRGRQHQNGRGDPVVGVASARLLGGLCSGRLGSRGGLRGGGGLRNGGRRSLGGLLDVASGGRNPRRNA